MSIKLELPKLATLRPRITVVGVGGAGGNAVNNMILSGLQGVDFVVANTDAQALQSSSAEHRIQLGVNLTEGLGAGSRPEIGEAAAEEAIEEIRACVDGRHMLFIAAGMGGGTGTGAAAVIARIAREAGVLTVGIVTKPFQFEGTRRARMADAGIAELKRHVDTLIVIPNQNLFRIANEKTTFAEAFVLADQVLYSGIACIVDLIVKDGLINLDFADVRTVMQGMGTAVMGTGEGEGPRRAIMAAEEAIANPLLDDVSLKGAKGLLLSITGGRDLTLYEVDEAASRVRQEVDPEANIIVGATFDETLEDRVRVSIVASGMSRAGEQPGVSSPAQAEAYAPALRTEQPPRLATEPVVGPSVVAAAAAGPARAAPAATSAQPALLTPEPVMEARQVPQMPSRSEPKPAGSPAGPMAGDQDDLSRRLSAAFDYGDTGYDSGATQAAEPAPSFDPSSTIAGEPWRAPGDVMIEEAAPQLGAASAPPPVGRTAGPPPLRQGTPTSTHAASELFEPARPAEIKRGQRRLPEVDDFPAVGQREYYAKTSRGSGEGQPQAAQPAPYAPPMQPQQDAVRKKPGLLARLTGRGKGLGDSAGQSGGYQQAPGRSSQPLAAERSHPGYAGQDGRDRRGTVGSREDVELPVFFSGERK